MDPTQRSSGPLLGSLFPLSSLSSLHFLYMCRVAMDCGCMVANIYADRASADIAQLLRRFENLIALAPVSFRQLFFLFEFESYPGNSCLRT